MFNFPILADLTLPSTSKAFHSAPRTRMKSRRLARATIVNGVKYQLHATRGWKKVGRVKEGRA